MTPALVETVRLRGGVAPLWPLHLARLTRSAADLGIALPPVTPPPRAAEGGWRVEVDAGGMRESFREVGSTEPLALRVVAVVHPGYPHKTTERSAFDQARREARRSGADEGLLRTPDGLVAECSIWSLLWWGQGGLEGPPLALGILPGVGRARAVEVVGGIEERTCGVGELQGRSLICVNALRGVVPVAALDGQAVPSDPRTERLRKLFWP